MKPQTSPSDLTPDQGFRLWIDLMETTDGLLRSGIQATLKPGESFEEVYRQWHQQRSDEHGDAFIEMCKNFDRALAQDQTDNAS